MFELQSRQDSIFDFISFDFFLFNNFFFVNFESIKFSNIELKLRVLKFNYANTFLEIYTLKSYIPLTFEDIQYS